MLKLNPGTNQYRAMRVKFLAQGKQWKPLMRFKLTLYRYSTVYESDRLTIAPCPLTFMTTN